MQNTNGVNGNIHVQQEYLAGGAGGGQTQTQIDLFEGEIQNLNDQIGVASTTRDDTFQKSQEVLVPLQTAITQTNEKVTALTQQFMVASTFAQTASANLQTANDVVASALGALNSVPEGDEAAKAQALADYNQAVANQRPCQQAYDEAVRNLQQVQDEMTKTMEELTNLNNQYMAENTRYTTELAQLDTQINLLQTQVATCQNQVTTLQAQATVEAAAAQAAQAGITANDPEKRVENGVEFDVTTQINPDGTKQEIFFQNGIKIKSRDLDALGRITKGTHYDENNRETGHYDRAYNEDGSFYDKWYDGNKTYTSVVTHRDAAGNTLNEIKYHSVTGEVMQPETRVRVENGVEYTIETKANQNGTYTEIFYQNGVMVKSRNHDGRGRITEGVHYNENGEVTGRYGRAYHEDGSYTDAWFDGNNTEPSKITQRDAFGNDKEALAAQAEAEAAAARAQAEAEAAAAQAQTQQAAPAAKKPNGNNSHVNAWGQKIAEEINNFSPQGPYTLRRQSGMTEIGDNKWQTAIYAQDSKGIMHHFEVQYDENSNITGLIEIYDSEYEAPKDNSDGSVG